MFAGQAPRRKAFTMLKPVILALSHETAYVSDNGKKAVWSHDTTSRQKIIEIND